MKVGLLGGTFDPVHLGHLVTAEEVRIKLGLAEVLFVPAGLPWFKVERRISPAPHRLEMLRLALASNPHFKISRLEIDRPGPSHSVETVGLLREQLGAERDIYFLLGADALADLPRWKEPDRLLCLCQIVGMTRPGFRPNLGALEKALPGSKKRLCLVEVPEIGISSSAIRERRARGLSIRYWVPEAVAEYIERHGLYLEWPKEGSGSG